MLVLSFVAAESPRLCVPKEESPLLGYSIDETSAVKKHAPFVFGARAAIDHDVAWPESEMHRWNNDVRCYRCNMVDYQQSAAVAAVSKTKFVTTMKVSPPETKRKAQLSTSLPSKVVEKHLLPMIFNTSALEGKAEEIVQGITKLPNSNP